MLFPKVPLDNFQKKKKKKISANNIIKNSDKEKWVYSLYFMEQVHGILLMNLLRMLSFSLLIIAYVLVLGEGPSYDINGSFGSPEKKISLFIEKKSLSLKLIIKISALFRKHI